MKKKNNLRLFLLSSGLAGLTMTYVLLLQARGVTQQQTQTAQESKTISCQPTPDKSQLSVANQTNVNPCLFASCSVVF